MHPTLRLLRFVGSPFAQGATPLRDEQDRLDLYDHALKNRIGLLYLERLKEQGWLGKLEAEYGEQCRKRSEILLTLTRAATLLDSAGVEYVVFKSNLPYPAVTNDVDILLLGSDSESGKGLEVMLQAGYEQIGAAALEVMFHDARGVPHEDPKGKDVYDVDLYKEVAATYITYMDKKKLGVYATRVKVLDREVRTLVPEADLATMIIHSVFPEQIYTLMLYYAILWHLATMNAEEIERFVKLVRENHIVAATRSCVRITAGLHKAAHGFVPRQLEEIQTKLGARSPVEASPRDSNLRMPKKYGVWTVMAALLEKMRERRARHSAVQQAIHMLNPSYAKYVARVFVERRRRETY